MSAALGARLPGGLSVSTDRLDDRDSRVTGAGLRLSCRLAQQFYFTRRVNRFGRRARKRLNTESAVGRREHREGRRTRIANLRLEISDGAQTRGKKRAGWEPAVRRTSTQRAGSQLRRAPMLQDRTLAKSASMRPPALLYQLVRTESIRAGTGNKDSVLAYFDSENLLGFPVRFIVTSASASASNVVKARLHHSV